VYHVNKNYVEYILCLQCRIYLMFTFSERHVTMCHYMINGHVTVYHYNDTLLTMMHRSFDNGQRHLMAFWPISEAAHSYHMTDTNDTILSVAVSCNRYTMHVMLPNSGWHKLFGMYVAVNHIFYFYNGLILALCFISVGALILFVGPQVSALSNIQHTICCSSLFCYTCCDTCVCFVLLSLMCACVFCDGTVPCIAVCMPQLHWSICWHFSDI